MQGLSWEMLACWGRVQALSETEGEVSDFLKTLLPGEGSSLQQIYAWEQFIQGQLQPTPQKPLPLTPQLWQQLLSSNCLIYLRKGEVMAHYDGQFVWVNPTQHIQQPLPPTTLLILASSDLHVLLETLRLLQANPSLQVLTFAVVERVFRGLMRWVCEKAGVGQWEGRVRLLKPQEYYRYGSLMLLGRETCWYSPAFDCVVGFGGGEEQLFLVEGQKLDSIKLLYLGWKRGNYTEQRYQFHIHEWDKNITRPTPGTTHLLKSPPPPQGGRPLRAHFLNFASKELIRDLQTEEKDELFSCCQLIVYTPQQVIFKTGYQADHLFMVVSGEVITSNSRDTHYLEGSGKDGVVHGLREVGRGEKDYLSTLTAGSEVEVLRVERHNLQFLLEYSLRRAHSKSSLPS